MERKGKLPFDPKVFLSKVNGGRAISDYQKDQIVYTQGESADSVFYIHRGKVKKTVASEQGKEAVVALLGTGDFFGEGCLTGQPLRLATVSVVTECVIVRITKANITRVIHEEPAFAELFIAHLLARNSRVEEDLVGCRSLARSPGRAGKTSRRHSGPRLAPSSVGGRGYLPRPRTSMAPSQCRPCQPRPTQGDVGDRELPHGSARRPCRALREREVRLYADRL